jgi:hypothetical protein
MFLKGAGYVWNGKAFYVESLPGQGGKDWGYTEKKKDAAPLSASMVEAFKAHCLYVGQAFFETVVEV